jgi:Cu/Ag efflux pump CusA
MGEQRSGMSEALGLNSPILSSIIRFLVTAPALLPIVIGGNKPGHEIEHPLAVIILSGLVTSTILNLFLLPALYLLFAKRKG